jgi:predicted ATPase
VILGRIDLYPYAILIIAATHPEIGKQRRREAETQSMITQIEIDGFKTFKDFKLELAPFQVIVGPNGSGKSNLFDALQLLSQILIPGNDVYKAMQGIRGEAGELFTKYPDGTTSDTIRIAVEVLVDRKEFLSDGREIDLKFARFRYEMEIQIKHNRGEEYQQYIKREKLSSIPLQQDNWCKKHNISPNIDQMRHNMNLRFYGDIAPILQTLPNKQMRAIIAQLSIIEDVDIKNLENFRNFVEIGAVYSTIVQKEISSLSFYHLNPEALRKRSSTSAPRYLAPDGSNLPATLARIKAEDPLAFQFISHDITSLVSDVLSVDVEKYDAIGEYGIRVTTSDKRTFTAQALSDGTLRLLALATLRNDPQFQGTICIEEPENGVQPLYLKQFARLLHDMATDFVDPERADEPLRQVIVTTHSPTFISQPEVIDHLLLATMPTRVSPETQSLLSVTRMEPVMTHETLARMSSDEDRASKYYTIDIVRQYLDSGTLQQADERLKQARSDLQKM